MHLELRLSWSRSLKDKRRILHSVKEKLKQRFNISLVESDYQDQLNHALVSLAQVALQKEVIYRTFQRIEDFVNDHFSLEILHVDREVQ